MAKYVVDIDGTICSAQAGLSRDYRDAEPFLERIKTLNDLYDRGHTIVYFSARGMGSSRDRKVWAYLRWWAVTRRQLKTWGAKHHKLLLGKPSGDFYIDDKGIAADLFFG
jgi:hypothetical protein